MRMSLHAHAAGRGVGRWPGGAVFCAGAAGVYDGGDLHGATIDDDHFSGAVPAPLAYVTQRGKI